VGNQTALSRLSQPRPKPPIPDRRLPRRSRQLWTF
jgi:hypothetical protein